MNNLQRGGDSIPKVYPIHPIPNVKDIRSRKCNEQKNAQIMNRNTHKSWNHQTAQMTRLCQSLLRLSLNLYLNRNLNSGVSFHHVLFFPNYPKITSLFNADIWNEFKYSFQVWEHSAQIVYAVDSTLWCETSVQRILDARLRSNNQDWPRLMNACIEYWPLFFSSKQLPFKKKEGSWCFGLLGFSQSKGIFHKDWWH